MPAAAPEDPRLADAAVRGSAGGDVERSRRHFAAARAAAEEKEVRTETELNRELSPDVTQAVAEAGAAVHDAPHAQPDGASAVHSEAGQGASTSVRQLEQQGREQQQGQDREGQRPQQQAERQQQRGSGADEDTGAS